MRSFAPLALVAVAAAAQAQTLEQRAAEVRNTLAAPPPVETVIQSVPAPVGRTASPAAAAAPPATPNTGPATVQTPAVQPVPASPDLTRRINALFGGQSAVDDGRGIGLTGTPQWLSNPRAPTHIPGFVTHATTGQAVRGASNLTTAPRSFSAVDANP